MNILDMFRKKPLPGETQAMPETEPPTLVIPSQVVLLKPMKWVVSNNQVCIVTKVYDGGYVDLAIVNPEGLTTGTHRTAVGNLRLARLAEIPASRRPTNPAYAATLGYV